MSQKLFEEISGYPFGSIYQNQPNRTSFVAYYLFPTEMKYKYTSIISKGACTNHVDKVGERGVDEMSTLLNNCYYVIVSAKGEGSKILKILST